MDLPRWANDVHRDDPFWDERNDLFLQFLDLAGNALRYEGDPSAAAAVGSLLTHARARFATEQEQMCCCDYPERPAHEDEHRVLLREICALQYLQGREERFCLSAIEQLQRWLPAHLSGTDRRLSAYLRERPSRQRVAEQRRPRQGEVWRPSGAGRLFLSGD